ncbi:MAG TPA: hypothetical protein VNY05_28425 [Candidatus Acidoferrales bacterium]|jgi:hypothetical protein|nr:hypothetical protein [Candidatus Acidoferrales bacterium]
MTRSFHDDNPEEFDLIREPAHIDIISKKMKMGFAPYFEKLMAKAPVSDFARQLGTRFKVEVEAADAGGYVPAPKDLLRRQVEAHQLVFPVGGEVHLAEWHARGDALVVPGLGDFDLAQQVVGVVDVVDADSGSVGDVQQTLKAAGRLSAIGRAKQSR